MDTRHTRLAEPASRPQRVGVGVLLLRVREDVEGAGGALFLRAGALGGFVNRCDDGGGEVEMV